MINIDDGATTVTIYDTWDRTEADSLILGRAISINGDEIDYKWGKTNNWSLSIENIPSSDYQQLNEWWADQTDLSISVDTGTFRILGASEPFTSLIKPYTDESQGSLLLRKL